MKRFLSLIGLTLASINLAFAAVNINTATPADLDGVKGIGRACGTTTTGASA